MQIRNVTKFTREVGREYQRVHYRMRIMRFQIISTVLFLAGGGICFWQGILGTAIALCSLAVLINLTFGIIFFITARRHNKFFEDAKVPIFVYDFYENTMNLSTKEHKTRRCSPNENRLVSAIAFCCLGG